MEKLKNIEFLRIVGCFAIIFFHFFCEMKNIDTYSHLHNITSCGNKAVDLFFILSGFFFTIGFKPDIKIWDFLKKKLIRIYPVLCFVIVLTLLLPFCKFSFFDVLITFFGLNGTPIAMKEGAIYPFWYVSSLLWTLLLYTYLLKNYDKKNVDLFIIISIFISYGMILHALHGKIHATTKFHYFINIGFLRALGGIGIGYFIGQWYKNIVNKLKNLCLNIYQKLFITIIEGYCLFFIVQNLMLHKFKYDNQIIYIIIFSVILILFLIKKGLFSNILNNNICSFLGKYTYSIFMVHIIIIDLLKYIYKNYTTFYISHAYLFAILYTLMALLLGIFTYHFIEKPSIKYLKQYNSVPKE